MKLVFVVAAIAHREGKIFLARKSQGKVNAGKWEFPGGKIHEGESDRDALKREIKEEFGIEITVTQFAGESRQHPIILRGYLVDFIEEPNSSIDHDDMKWVTFQEARKLNLSPADFPLLESAYRIMTKDK